MKRGIVFAGIVGIVVVVGLFIVLGTGSKPVSGQEITMYKSPSCGCCVGHAGYLEGEGYGVDIIANGQALANVKAEQNIPVSVRSCHTSIIEGYFVEGHMPIEAINKLLEERPDIDGIALPDMPVGAPGMPGRKQGEWIIYAIKDGQVSEFMKY